MNNWNKIKKSSNKQG